MIALSFPSDFRLLKFIFICLGFFQLSLAQSTYTVVRGDTLYDIARNHATSVETLKQLNNLNTSVIYEGQRLDLPQLAASTPSRVGIREHVVVQGETLESLTKTYELEELSLRNANPSLQTVQLSSALPAGLTLLIPPQDGTIVVVEPKQNLLSLALSYGMSVAELAKINGIQNPRDIAPGSLVFVPVDASKLPSPPSSTSTSAPQPVASITQATGREAHLLQQTQLISKAVSLLKQYEPPVQTFIWPITGRLTSRYGRRNISVGGNTFHSGIDIASNTGTPIRASRGGTIIRAGWGGAYGYVVYLDHGDGSQTRYAHMSQIMANTNTFVSQGEVLGLVGSTGASTGPHLHFEIRFSGHSVDPLAYLE